MTDPSGAVVSGVEVAIANDYNGTTQATTTDQVGTYRFSFLAPAKYTLTVSHGGFRTVSRTLNVLLGPPVSVNLTLQVASTTTSVLVTSDAPMVHAENGDVSTTMNTQQISEVPNPGNDISYVAMLAPGSVMNTDSGYGFSILGMPSSSYLFTIDGLNNNENGENTATGGASRTGVGTEPNPRSDGGDHWLLWPIWRSSWWQH